MINAVDDERSFVRRKLVDLAITIAVLVLFLVVIVAVFVGGGIVEDIAGAIGLGDTGARGLADRPLAAGAGGGDARLRR